MPVILTSNAVHERFEIILNELEFCASRLRNPDDAEMPADTISRAAGRVEALHSILSDTVEHVRLDASASRINLEK